MSVWARWLAAQEKQRADDGLTRRLIARPADDATIDLAGNDYLGLARHPRVCRAAADAALLWGAGAGASRLVTGTLALHAELETALAGYMHQETALVFSTGYHANLSVVSALADRDTLVLSDAHIHASLIDAVRLSRAEVEVVAHNDVDAVRAGLAKAAQTSRRAMVLVESVYSVLGDAAPLRELSLLCKEYDALLIVDEAHGLGVRGPGLVAREGLAGQPHVVVTATLSKSLGAQGGAVLGSAAVREHLVNRARPFIFDTGLAPAAAAGALAALAELRAQPELEDVVRRRVVSLAEVFGIEPPAGAVLSIPMPTPQAALSAQAAAYERGVRVGCFRPPSVPDGISRLRITATAGIDDSSWAQAVEALREVVGQS